MYIHNLVMRFGIGIPSIGPMSKTSHMLELVQYAEQLGFDSLTIGDHIIITKTINSLYPYTDTRVPPTSSFSGEWFEPLTTLAFVAGITQKIKLMTSVMVIPYRDPIFTAKILSTIDNLSQGRLIIGAGVGWMEEEFEVLERPPFKERGAVTDEYINIFNELWTNDSPSFKGKYTSFPEINFYPKPVQEPHPPIWIGGESPPALKRAARLGDGWYPIGRNPVFPLKTIDQMNDSISILIKHIDTYGRNLNDFTIGYSATTYKITDNGLNDSSDSLFVGDVNKIITDIEKFAEIGVNFISFQLVGDNLDETKERMRIFSKEIIKQIN